MKFNPCTGDCTEDTPICLGCGRTREEVDAMRGPVGELVALAEEMKYENLEEFAAAVAGSIRYKLGLGH